MKNIVTSHIWSRKRIYLTDVYGVEFSYISCYIMNCDMEINTEERMDTLVYTHSRYDSEELVFRNGSLQRDNRLGRVESQLKGYF
jgi:hypothetical protein